MNREYNGLSRDRKMYYPLQYVWKKSAIVPHNKGENIGNYKIFNQTFQDPIETPAGSFLNRSYLGPIINPQMSCFPNNCPAGLSNYNYNTFSSSWKPKGRYNCS